MPRRNLRASKNRIRKSILAIRNKQPPEFITRASAQIVNRVMDMPHYKTSKIIMLYSGKEKEVQTKELICTSLDKEKHVVLPITNVKRRFLELSEIKDYDELEVSTFNVLEPKKEFIRPVSMHSLELIVVPGVGFDYHGNRLGYGKAYYDKLLQLVRRSVPLIGLAFQFQVKQYLPHSRYDIPMDYIVTEHEIINCRGSGR